MAKGTRAHNKWQRYQTIVSAAEELFIKHGLDTVQMKDVASAAGIGIATLFRYFPKKDQLIVAVATKNLKRTMDDLSVIVQANKTAYQRLEDVLDYLFKKQTTNKHAAIKFREAFESYASFTKEPIADIHDYIDIQKQIIQILQPVIEDGENDGTIRKDIPIKDTITTIINAYGTFASNIILKESITYTEAHFTPERQQQILKDILLSYVRPSN
ncbi:HTH-type transcriptional repressor KstR [Paraliobacillus sp. PM-2]|uniref:TetR/AcrR family transcriptional regulator n=1 Tax=Paraliobacillus sp. PM-2 TaxID=1462524 RepID=UPI00061BBF44|nr:TetR/AcrR family transcriptional regulator [Paraliobacillus sp. PM-2]CQR47257.1 HTH-type transcriptional repressor KstR [Paraliobacillus sp. PM-2]